MNNETRIPRQKRSIEKYEKIIDAGWKLISKNGYYNTNTKEIAKEAGVSTGIVYQYFNDKYDILLAGIKKYGDDIFYPALNLDFKSFDINNFESYIKLVIDKHIKDHKLSKSAHEEIMAMVHSDKNIAAYYYDREMKLTNDIYDMLINNNIKSNNLKEKVHIIIGMIDNLCHEVVYHNHSELNYDDMINIVIKNIYYLIKEIN